MRSAMAKRTTVDLTDADEEALKKVMRRWGQQNESAVIRLCLHMVANAKEMLLESPVIDPREPGREG